MLMCVALNVDNNNNNTQISFSYRDVANKRQTPLSCAAEAGKHDIVAYLLSISGVTTEGVNMDEVHFAVAL